MDVSVCIVIAAARSTLSMQQWINIPQKAHVTRIVHICGLNQLRFMKETWNWSREFATKIANVHDNTSEIRFFYVVCLNCNGSISAMWPFLFPPLRGLLAVQGLTADGTKRCLRVAALNLHAWLVCVCFGLSCMRSAIVSYRKEYVQFHAHLDCFFLI